MSLGSFSYPSADGQFSPEVPHILPHEKMYLVQIGDTMFSLSGASLSSDAPSYFTEYFTKRERERYQAHSPSAAKASDRKDILYIDRSPEIFRLIYSHLQGYFINIKDEVEYTMLFADAIYYNLPRLRALLRDSDHYYSCIGGQSFKIPKSLFNRKGDSLNYFEVTTTALYAGIEDCLIRQKMIRPPPQSPPYVARCPELFKDILALLGGVSLELDDKRRESLVKECRYYRLLALEQRLLKCVTRLNPICQNEEIVMKLDDLKKVGVGLVTSLAASRVESSMEDQCPRSPLDDQDDNSASTTAEEDEEENYGPPCKKPKFCGGSNWIMATYKRPFIDSYARELVFQVDSMQCILFFNKREKTIHVNFKDQLGQQFENVFKKLLRDCGVDLGKFVKEGDDFAKGASRNVIIPACVAICDFRVNGIKANNICSLLEDNKLTERVPNFKRGGHDLVPGLKLYLSKSLWRLGVKNGEIMLIALRAECISGIKEYNKTLEFL